MFRHKVPLDSSKWIWINRRRLVQTRRAKLGQRQLPILLKDILQFQPQA